MSQTLAITSNVVFYVNSKLRLVASANSTIIVEFIDELIEKLFIVELLYGNYFKFLKT